MKRGDRRMRGGRMQQGEEGREFKELNNEGKRRGTGGGRN